MRRHAGESRAANSGGLGQVESQLKLNSNTKYINPNKLDLSSNPISST